MSYSQATPEQVAFHEAGHCVAAYLTGICTMEGVNHVAGAKTAQAEFEVSALLKAARSRSFQNLSDADHDKELAVILGAGLAAERRYLELRHLPIDEHALSLGAHGDLQEVRRLLGAGFWVAAETAARKLFDEIEVWDAVEALASMILREDGQLSGNQVTECLESALALSEVSAVQVLKL